MRRATGTRELTDLTVGAVVLRVTYHRPFADGASADAAGRIGVVFVNSLVMPRSQLGDAAVYWASAFADLGYPAFRVDLPGLGDSAGDLPAEVLEFVCGIDGGALAPLTAECVTALVQRFGLGGAIVVGHCAGTVTALFAAAVSGDIKGLILLDPYFHVHQRIVTLPWPTRAVKHLQAKWRDWRHTPTEWAARSLVGETLQMLYRSVKDSGVRALRPAEAAAATLPPNPNKPLLKTWERLVAAGLPILVLTAPPSDRALADFDDLRYLERRARGRDTAVFQSIEGVTHSFLENGGKRIVRTRAEEWLTKYFPQDEHRRAGVAVRSRTA